MAIDLSGIASWLHGWFPYHSEVVASNQTVAGANKDVVTDEYGNVTLDTKVSVGSNTDLSMSSSNVISHTDTVTAKSTSAIYKVKHNSTGHITESGVVNTSDLPNSQVYNNIKSGESTSLTMTNQKLVNDGINTKLGSIDSTISSLVSTEYIKIDTADSQGKPSTSPSQDTMNTIYLVKNGSGLDDNYDEFITVRSGTSGNYTYAWEKIGTTSLDLSNYVQKSSTTGLIKNDGSIMASGTGASNWAVGNHSHGNITNAGKVGSTANKPLITTTGGAVTTGSFGTSANTFCQGNDSRLSDARTPTSHAHGNIRNDGTLYQYSNKIVVTNAMSSIIGVDSLGASQIIDPTTGGYSNIGSSQNATQETINGLINTALGNKANSSDIPTDVSDLTDTNNTAFKPKSHNHGNITSDGRMGNESGGIVVTGTNGVLTKTWMIKADKVYDDNSYTHIGILGEYFQEDINDAIDTAIGNLQSSTITSISLVPKSTDANGKIIFYTGDEPS